MAWTTPRTWSDGEVPTAAMMNAHVRDNELIIKTTRDDLGKLPALSSTYLASLDPSNLTGLARVASSNDFSDGTHLFSGGRIVLPVGADKFQDLGGGLRRGIWVEGTALHHIASNQTTEYSYVGTFVSTPAGAKKGSLWVDGDTLRYVDANGDQRSCVSAGSAGHSDVPARGGSAWIETYVHWIRESGKQEKPGHADVAHSDGAAHDDISHSDSHSDAHTDVAHSDAAHSDVAHTDVAHVDGSHHDHNDGPGHADSHTDILHSDVPHSDRAHGDTAHGDAHFDTAHSDVAHSDHSDHGDSVHQDRPVIVP